MTYQELKNKDNYCTIGYGKKTKFFQDEQEAMAHIEDNGLPHIYHSVWTDEMGYPHETVHAY